MTNWEYLCVEIVWNNLTQKQQQLNVCGLQGWELIHITESKIDTVTFTSRATFKKPL